MIFWYWKHNGSLINNITRKFVQKRQDETGQGSRFAGDGRFDSPGWTARFCNYFIQVCYCNSNKLSNGFHV